jgi:hypothetical protein
LTPEMRVPLAVVTTIDAMPSATVPARCTHWCAPHCTSKGTECTLGHARSVVWGSMLWERWFGFGRHL